MTASVQERLKLKRITLDTWSTKEKLSLASSVVRSGDQNWSCVSRNIRMFAEPNRPPDWFSQRNCAQQYASLLENVETPKRKKRTSGGGEKSEVETPGECIVRKLTLERIEELKKVMAEEQANYLKLKDDVNAIIGGQADDRLQQMLLEVEDEKKQKEREKEAHIKWLREREERKIELERAWKPGSQLSHLRRASSISEPSSEADSPLSEPLNVDVAEESVLPKPTPTSPLLTSLLKSPSATSVSQTNSILHSAITSPHRGSSPTIASLLSSAPGLPGNLTLPPTSVSSNLKNLVSNAISGSYGEDHNKTIPQSPSQGAPTLSMLLELPPSMPGKPLPMLQTQPAAPPPYTDHLGPPPPYSQATEYLQKQRAEQLSQSQSGSLTPKHTVIPKEEEISDVYGSNIGSTSGTASLSPVSARRNSLKGRRLDLSQAEPEPTTLLSSEGGNASNKTTPVKETKRILHNTSDHDYIESPVKDKDKTSPVKTESRTPKNLNTDVFEFDEKKEGYDKFDLMLKESKMSYLKSNAQRQTKKEGDATSPRLTHRKDSDTFNVSPNFIKANEHKSYLKERESERLTSPLKDVKLDLKERLGGENEEDIPLKELAKKEHFNKEISPSKENTQRKELEKSPVLKTENESSSPRKDIGFKHLSPLKEIELGITIKSEDDSQRKSCDGTETENVSFHSRENPSTRQSLRSHSADDALGKDKPAIIVKRKTSETESTKLKKFPSKESIDVSFGDKKVDINQQLSSGDVPDVEFDSETKKTDGSNDQSEEEKNDEPEDSESAKEDDVLSHLLEVIKSEKTDFSATEDEKSNDAAPRSYTRRRPTSINYSDSVPSSPGPSTEEEKDHKTWKKSVMLVYTRIAGHKFASLFLKPITDEQAPSYSQIVHRPMDLSTIKRNIELGNIRTTQEFQRDVMLMFLNAIMYNKTDDHVYTMAREMQIDCLEHFQMLVQATGENVPSRRETRTQQDVKSRTQDKSSKITRSFPGFDKPQTSTPASDIKSRNVRTPSGSSPVGSEKPKQKSMSSEKFKESGLKRKRIGDTAFDNLKKRKTDE